MSARSMESDAQSLVLPGNQVEAIVAAAEAGLQVRRRYQFFVWTQGSLQAALPHQLSVCGAYLRSRHDLAFEAFNAVPVEASLLATLSESRSLLMQMLQERWLQARGKPVRIRSVELPEALSLQRRWLEAAGLDGLMAHGVSRPHRPDEIESFFLMACQGGGYSPRQALCFELLLPHVHSSWLRVQSVERELSELPMTPTAKRSSGAHITDRERQILRWLREGRSNPQIGETLGISPLTVKNHVQKILRKLGAANRAQAVAVAISLNLLSSSASADEAIGVGRRSSHV